MRPLVRFDLVTALPFLVNPAEIFDPTFCVSSADQTGRGLAWPDACTYVAFCGLLRAQAAMVLAIYLCPGYPQGSIPMRLEQFHGRTPEDGVDDTFPGFDASK
jgi:hypothetical protein